MSDIDEVKARTNIIDVIGARVTLKKAGRHWKALCPFHSEKTPSFIVSPERQSWKCFGCGRGGSVIDFVMEYEHVDFVEALETLAEKAGVKLEHRAGQTPEGKIKQQMYEVNHLASEFYHYLLTKHSLGEKARSYLKTRSVDDKAVKTFMLGYSPNSWDGLLKYLTKKGYEGELLEKAGLVIKSQKYTVHSTRYYDRFRGRVMFALKDHRGNVVGFSGRLLDPGAKDPPSLKASEGQAAKYINTSETPVYSKSSVLYGMDVTKAAIQKEGEAIVMEGEFDVISSFQAGIPNVVAIKGSALTEGHVNLLRRFAERIIFALDSDVAGDAASRRGIEIADRAGLDMRVVTLPVGKDPDELAKKSPGLLKKTIANALPIYDYFIDSAAKRFDITTAFGKKKASEEVLPVLAKIDNPIVRGHFAKKLGKLLDASEEVIEEGIARVLRDTRRPVERPGSSPTSTGPAVSRLGKLEVYTLGLILQGKTSELFEEFVQRIEISDLTSAAVRRIVSELEAFLKVHPVFLIKDFADALPKELVGMLDEAFLWDLSTILDDEEKFAKEWERTLWELRRLSIRQKLTDLNLKLKESDETDPKEFAGIHEEIRVYTNELKKLEENA